MRRLSAGGDTWRVTSTGDDPRRDVRTFVFHCLSNTQRPYRVIEVPSGVADDRPLDRIPDRDLGELFDRAHALDYSVDPAASGVNRGFGDPPLDPA